jgi:hypothetical protein
MKLCFDKIWFRGLTNKVLLEMRLRHKKPVIEQLKETAARQAAYSAPQQEEMHGKLYSTLILRY